MINQVEIESKTISPLFEGIQTSLVNFGSPLMSHSYGQSNSSNQFQSNSQFQSQNVLPGMYSNGSMAMTSNQHVTNFGLSNASQQSNSSGILMPSKINDSNDDFRDLLL